MNKWSFLSCLILLIINCQLIICQNQEVNIEEENKRLIELRNNVFRAIKDGYKPIPSEEEKKRWENKRKNKCGGSWIANLPDFYATEEEIVSIVVVSGYFTELPSISSSEVKIDIENKIFKVKSNFEFYTGCDGCVSEKETDTIYVGKLPAGDYTVFYERDCSFGIDQDTLSFSIYPSDTEEQVVKMKRQKLLEQLPENLPPMVDGNYRKGVRIQYVLTKAEEMNVTVYDLLGREVYKLLESKHLTKLGYNEIYLPLPKVLTNRNVNSDSLDINYVRQEYFKIVVIIGENRYEDLTAYRWSN